MQFSLLKKTFSFNSWQTKLWLLWIVYSSKFPLYFQKASIMNILLFYKKVIFSEVLQHDFYCCMCVCVCVCVCVCICVCVCLFKYFHIEVFFCLNNSRKYKRVEFNNVLIRDCVIRFLATAQKMKFSMLWIWSHLLKKSFMENFIFWAASATFHHTCF